jgi:RNA polymerase sigma-70 factor (ECF subfamily)
MNAGDERDEWLMAQLALGKREHLEPLVRRYANPLFTFIRRMIGDHHCSEEVFQDVLLAVWSKRHQYEFPRSFKSWLFGIALNKCRAQYRSRGSPCDVSLVHRPPWFPSSPDHSPVDVAIATETAEVVTAAVARLPEQQRATVILRIWNGLSYAEIAETLGRSEATVRSNMHHALAALRKHLEPIMRPG